MLRQGRGRRPVALILAVFAIGAGIGALAIALSHHPAPQRVIVKRVHTTAQAGKVPGARTGTSAANATTTLPAASAGVQPDAGASRRVGSRPVALVSDADRTSFTALAAGLGGQVGIAVAPLGEGAIEMLGSLQAGHAWSTMKVPVLAALLADDERAGRAPSSQERTDATLALEQSDNAAAESLFAQLKQIHGGLSAASEAVQQRLYDAGDRDTTVNTAANSGGFTTWGQSIWSAGDEVVFYRALARGCLLSAQDTDYVLELMRHVIPSQRWGAGSAGYPSSLPLAFKAGWGPEGDGGYLVRQTAVIGSGEGGYVLSMIALPSGGSFAEGVDAITTLARWAREHLALPQDATGPGGCGG